MLLLCLFLTSKGSSKLYAPRGNACGSLAFSFERFNSNARDGWRLEQDYWLSIHKGSDSNPVGPVRTHPASDFQFQKVQFKPTAICSLQEAANSFNSKRSNSNFATATLRFAASTLSIPKGPIQTQNGRPLHSPQTQLSIPKGPIQTAPKIPHTPVYFLL